MTVVSVGYGRTQLNQPPDDPNQNTKRYRVTKSLGAAQTTLIGYDMQNSGICQGDSGGPVLVGSPPNERVVGIHSFVRGTRGSDCNGEGWSARVQSGASFWNAQLAKAAPPNDCAFCEKVANSGNGECVKMTKGCFADPDCKGYFECVGACTNINCRFDCANKFPKAQGPREALSACVCARACADKCGTTSQCAGVPKCGYKLPEGDCSTCMEGACCNETFDCTRDGSCYLCLKNKDADPGCATNAARKALATCVAKSCKAECVDTGLDVGADPVPEEEGGGGGGGTKIVKTEGCAVSGAGGASSSSSPFVVLGLALGIALLRRRR
jgi:MYXO-CTERM domain-containing protein